jgi:AcrR family transcriptional regulator
MSEPVKPRTRRLRKAQATENTIIAAAHELFLAHGYAAATIQSIADTADLAVETVYARFGNKPTLLGAVVDRAVDEMGAVPLDERPELAAIASERNAVRRVHLASGLSRVMLERIAPIYDVLREAARVDSGLSGLLEQQITTRRSFQRRLVQLVIGYRVGDEALERAAETYSALANPELFLLLTRHHGWTPDRFEFWLADCAKQLLEIY